MDWYYVRLISVCENACFNSVLIIVYVITVFSEAGIEFDIGLFEFGSLLGEDNIVPVNYIISHLVKVMKQNKILSTCQKLYEEATKYCCLFKNYEGATVSPLGFRRKAGDYATKQKADGR